MLSLLLLKILFLYIYTGDEAFRGCQALGSEVELPATVTSLGNYVFEGCGHLEEVTLPSNILVVGDGCFRRCTSLERLALVRRKKVQLASIKQITDFRYNWVVCHANLQHCLTIPPSSFSHTAIECCFWCRRLWRLQQPENTGRYSYRSRHLHLIQSCFGLQKCASSWLWTSLSMSQKMCSEFHQTIGKSNIDTVLSNHLCISNK